MQQLSLFSPLPTPYSLPAIKHDPYWDEITRESQEELLMVVDSEEESPTTISKQQIEELLMVVDSEETATTTISKRASGDGTGRITKRIISKNGKDYKQFWYDYQFYQNGRLIGRSRYIPKRLLAQIQALESEKVPVSRILEVLGVRS